MKTTNNNTQTNEEKIAKINADKELELAKLKAQKEKEDEKSFLYLYIGVIGVVLLICLGIYVVKCYDDGKYERKQRKIEKKMESLQTQIAKSLDKGDYYEAYAVVDVMKSNSEYKIRDKAEELEKKILMEEIAAAIDANEGDNSAARIIMEISSRYSSADYSNDFRASILKDVIELAELSGHDKLATRLREVLKEWDKK